MSKKIKVANKSKHNVGITLMSGASRNIVPGGFFIMDEEDVQNLMVSSKVFSAKHLTLEDTEWVTENGFDAEELKHESDDEIKTKLKKLSLDKLRAYLTEVTESHIRNRILEISKELDLAVSRINVINEVFEIES